MSRVGRVQQDSTSEAEGKATLTGSLVNVVPVRAVEARTVRLGVWGIVVFSIVGASDLTTADGGPAR